MSKNKRWPTLGIIVRNPMKDENGNVLKDDKGRTLYHPPQLKLDDSITVLHNGQPVALNEYRTGHLITPKQEVETLYKNGAIDDGEIEARRQKVQELDWLRYKIQLPPPRD